MVLITIPPANNDNTLFSNSPKEMFPDKRMKEGSGLWHIMRTKLENKHLRPQVQNKLIRLAVGHKERI